MFLEVHRPNTSKYFVQYLASHVAFTLCLPFFTSFTFPHSASQFTAIFIFILKLIFKPSSSQNFVIEFSKEATATDYEISRLFKKGVKKFVNTSHQDLCDQNMMVFSSII